jgi:hypothetical protein
MKNLITLAVVFFMTGIAEAKELPQQGANRNPLIVKFAKKHFGKKVGDGDCWDFAHEALISAGGKHPDNQPYAWGKKLNWPQEQVMPGDIIQTFNRKTNPAGQHTVIIYRVHARGDVTLAEQYFNGQPFVTKRKVNLYQLREIREMHIYRP